MFKWSFQSSFKSESPHTQTSLMNGIEVMYNGVCTLYVINNYLVSLYVQLVMDFRYFISHNIALAKI